MRKRRRSKNSSPLRFEKKTITTIAGISLIGFGLTLIASLFIDAGILLSLKDYFYGLFGVGIVLVPPLAVVLGLPLIGIRTRFSKINIIFGYFGALLSLVSLFAPFSPELAGTIGTILFSSVKSLLTTPGALIILLATLVISIIVTLNASPAQALAAIGKMFKMVWTSIVAIKSKFLGVSKRSLINKNQSGYSNAKSARETSSVPMTPQAVAHDDDGLSQSVVVNMPGQGQLWEFPPLSLLSEVRGSAANRGNVKQNAQIIERTLEAFGITAKVIEVNPGPTVTQYALEIPVGTKLSKILALQNDLALALATSTGNVRIEAPIPGKSLVGVEIPNITPEIVSLKSILADDLMRSNKSKLAVGLGKDVSGNTIITDLAKMPHVLIAGTTGSGKSILLNGLITTLLFRASPQEVKFIMVDPKRVELTDYNDIPHLLTPVIIEAEKSLSALKWATAEMDRRYKLFHDAQVRNITGYNELSGFQALPYIVIVIDELQNLMEFAPVEVEDTIVRLASMARATGIHLVVATQRPSVDVITGLIKANIPCRIAFNVSSMIDSRVILDQPGAEKLLGRGDMLYVPPDASKPSRIQGVYVSDTETRNLISFLKKSGFSPEYTEEVIQMPVGKSMGTGGADGDKDDLFQEAVRTICQYDRASASLLQRRLRVGYARAARLLDELEAAGIVGPGEGSKPRDVLVKNAQEYLESQAQPG